ncbi:MAG TPA: hypothetical protein VGC72_06510 [Candidatus Elarobacter sp.]|jgi:hypothetical protein
MNPLMRRLFTYPAALLAVCIMLDVIFAAARVHAHAPTPSAAPVLRQFAAVIDERYHECVPLGWYPEGRPHRGYYPGYNADVQVRGVVFQGLWVAEVRQRMLDDPHAVAVKSVLDELSRTGLLARQPLPDGFRYNLTREGQQYYYDRNDLDDNVDGWPYLCFSRLHAKDVAWASRPAPRRGRHGSETTARIRFTWEPTADAQWTTPFLKAHAVALNPPSSPAGATALRYDNGKWVLAQLDFVFPVVEHRAAWTRLATRDEAGGTLR